MATRTKKGTPFEFKAGIEGFEWGGMLTEGDPSANEKNRPRLLENARFFGGEITDRSGLTKLLAAQIDAAGGASVTYLGDHQITTPRKLWIVTDGCPGISSAVGFSLTCIDTEQDPEFQRVVYYDTLTSSFTIAGFDGNLHLGSDSVLRKLELLALPWGSSENLAVSGSSQDVPLVTFTGYDIGTMLEFDGKLFIGLDNGAGASRIVTWDGVSWRIDLDSIDPVTCFGLYRVTDGGDCIVAGFGSGTNHIQYRPTGDSPGSWTTVAPGAGTLDARQMISYKDVLYLADVGGDVWDFDGTTLASARTPAGSTTCKSVATFGGNLIFGYATAAAAIIGSYDGSSWTDAEKDFDAQFSGADDIRALAGYRGSLMVGGIKGATGGFIWASPGADITGTYRQIVMAGANNSDFDQFVVL